MHYRIRFNKEASSAEKLSFFSRARFEESKRGLLSAVLKEKLQPKTIGQRLAFNQKLPRLLEIDSKNAIKQCDIYYKAAPIESSLKMLESGDKKIEALEKEYIAQGMNASVARFSSIEIVKY